MFRDGCVLAIPEKDFNEFFVILYDFHAKVKHGIYIDDDYYEGKLLQDLTTNFVVVKVFSYH
jgi:hypothetical protein